MKRIFSVILLATMTNALALNPGDKAPDFKLKNHKGKEVTLKELNKNKIVVLEWYNEGCPYVRKHYDAKNMQNTQKTFKDNDYVTWVTIASSVKGKQGHVKNVSSAMELMQKEQSHADHFLLDSDGSVGKAYDAKTTPHMYVIDSKGIVRYTGAMDSIPSAKASDIAKAKNYVTSAVSKVLLQEKPNPSKTRPYGCSVKY